MLSEDREGKMESTFSCDKEVGSRNSESSKASCRSEAINGGQAGATIRSGPILIIAINLLFYMVIMAPRRYPLRWRGRCTEKHLIGVRLWLPVLVFQTMAGLQVVENLGLGTQREPTLMKERIRLSWQQADSADYTSN